MLYIGYLIILEGQDIKKNSFGNFQCLRRKTPLNPPAPEHLKKGGGFQNPPRYPISQNPPPPVPASPQCTAPRRNLGGVGTMGHTPTPSRFGATFKEGGGSGGGGGRGPARGGGGGSKPLHIWCEMAASSHLSL